MSEVKLKTKVLFSSQRPSPNDGNDGESALLHLRSTPAPVTHSTMEAKPAAKATSAENIAGSDLENDENSRLPKVL